MDWVQRSMDRVHRGGPWTWGPCFVYVPRLLDSDSDLTRTRSCLGHPVNSALESVLISGFVFWSYLICPEELV